ncbi:MAG: hypothetical protein K5634_03340 [Sphaerochaetaceae bacterium]|nr:hypothetical protein [Sphaerochaetaceae bacterium]
MKKYLIIIIVLALLVSCSNDVSTSTTEINLPVSLDDFSGVTRGTRTIVFDSSIESFSKVLPAFAGLEGTSLSEDSYSMTLHSKDDIECSVTESEDYYIVEGSNADGDDDVYFYVKINKTDSSIAEYYDMFRARESGNTDTTYYDTFVMYSNNISYNSDGSYTGIIYCYQMQPNTSSITPAICPFYRNDDFLGLCYLNTTSAGAASVSYDSLSKSSAETIKSQVGTSLTPEFTNAMFIYCEEGDGSISGGSASSTTIEGCISAYSGDLDESWTEYLSGLW